MRPDLADLPALEAEVNYVRRTDPAPRVYYVTPPEGEPLSTVEIDPRRVRIHDVRGHEDRFDLEEHGCCFLRDRIDFRDIENDAAVREIAYPAVEALARELVGTDHVVAFDHGVRRKRHGLDSAGKPRAGGVARNIADFAHNDYTPYSASLRVRWFLGEAAERLTRGRYAIFNFWWPLRGPLRDHPLALCVNASTAASDYVEICNVFERGPNPILGLAHHPDHQWIYKSALQENETLMFRTWDTGRPLAACVPHVAFADPTAGPDIPPRESIELRVLAFYDAPSREEPRRP